MIVFDSTKLKESMGGISQSAFARLLSDAKGKHVSPQQVSIWMSGASAPTGENLIAISRVTGQPPEKFYKASAPHRPGGTATNQ